MSRQKRLLGKHQQEPSVFIANRIEQANISSKSFIVTVFGDVISQHGNWVWLGSLIEALMPLGYSERLVRTSVFRLVKDDWLQATRQGRKSYYGFTSNAHKHYTKAARRIYAGTTQFSDGEWLIVMPSFVPEDQLTSFKRQLEWMGFSKLAPGAYAHPSIDQSSLEETINEMNLADSVIVFSSKTRDESSTQVLKKLVHEKWNINQLQQEYQDLIENYSWIAETVERPGWGSDQERFLGRTLLIHEYRRILLKDHELPEAMLPENWVGYKATQLVKLLYKKLMAGSLRFTQSQMYNADGLLPNCDAEFKQRFL